MSDIPRRRYTRWLWSALDKKRDVCYEQPQPLAPPTFDNQCLPSESQSFHRPSQWLVEGRNLASRASSRGSFSTRRTTNYRPVIGAPSDFRKVEHPNERHERFRPLELSIYRPGNELPPLPVFSEEPEEDEQGLQIPPQVWNKARSESLSSRPSMSFSIPRKPLGSTRSLSLDASQDCSYGGDLSLALGTRSIHRRPSIVTNKSAQDFLETLDSRLPKSPPPLRSKSGPEPVYTLYRRASEQSLRLQTHLQEREKIESQLPDCGTILEEKSPDAPRKFPDLSPISSHGDAADDLPQYPQSHCEHASSSFITCPSPAHLQSHASLHKLLETNSSPPAHSVSARSRISQWLLRSSSSLSVFESLPSPDQVTSPRRPSMVRDRASTVSSFSTSSNAPELATPWTTPRSSPRSRKKRGSISSCQTGFVQRLHFGEEKNMNIDIPVGIGVAFWNTVS